MDSKNQENFKIPYYFTIPSITKNYYNTLSNKIKLLELINNYNYLLKDKQVDQYSTELQQNLKTHIKSVTLPTNHISPITEQMQQVLKAYSKSVTLPTNHISPITEQMQQVLKAYSKSVAFPTNHISPITEQMQQVLKAYSKSVAFPTSHINPITEQMQQVLKAYSKSVAFPTNSINPITEQIQQILKAYSKSVPFPTNHINPIAEQMQQALNAYSKSILPTINIPNNIGFAKLIFKSNIELNKLSPKISKLIQEKLIFEEISIDFDKISYFLEYDIYLPITIMEDLPVTRKFSSQEDANEYFEEILKTLKENNISLIDLIPLTDNNINDVEKMEFLLEKKYYKILCLFCFERIENIFHILRYQYLHIDIINKDRQQDLVNSSLNILSDTTDDDLKKIIKNLMSNIINPQNNSLELNLYKTYSKDKTIKANLEKGLIPLNRNAFMHGVVDDKDINYTVASKAILAYSFFVTLTEMKKNAEDK
ncbi:hypothetical protein P7H30_11660 [Streptococcus parauberis]|uniref:hypothetical protein n=1 Tax=Streptococcus parauberis TaxID=1348 RepID=UPI00288E26E6|nr:hypothetical protein [Streptococcus parauberis]MDT2750349.1 hypothetical protein [Streptococcus parauberis]